MSRKEARAQAYELLERVGLTAGMADRYPVQLSGGQQQRVGVARALAADPPVMLMDEPFSAVDPVVREGLQQEFLRLQGELGKTIVMVTHDIDEAIKLGDHVAVFAEGGRLAQLAAPEELLSQPADDFVAGFVGRDRGFRGLSFAAAADLAVEPVDRRGRGPAALARRRRPPARLDRRSAGCSRPRAASTSATACAWSPTSRSSRRPAPPSAWTPTAGPTGWCGRAPWRRTSVSGSSAAWGPTGA